jgi:carnitine monooxygenase subunit
VDRDQLIDLTRRAVKLARGKTTDLTPSEHSVAADTYTSTQRLAQDTAMLLASPQLVGYASELSRPGTYCTKTVMGRSILLTRGADNGVRAFDNVCLHRQSRIADGWGAARRLACPYHSWTYDLDGNLVGTPGKEGASPKHARAREADRVTGRGICRLPVDFAGPRYDARYSGVSRAAQ